MAKSDWPQYRIEVDCVGPTTNNATVKVNGELLPLVALTLVFRSGQINRAILEVEPSEVQVVTDAVAEVRVAEWTDPNPAQGTRTAAEFADLLLPHIGKFVAMRNGEIVATGSTQQDIEALEQAGSGFTHVLAPAGVRRAIAEGVAS